MTLCERCQTLWDGFLDDALNEEEQAFFDQHLAKCTHCQHELAYYSYLKKELATWAQEELTPPDDLRAKVMEKLAGMTQESLEIPVVKSAKWKRYSARALPVVLAAALMMGLLPGILSSHHEASFEGAGETPLLAVNEPVADEAAAPAEPPENQMANLPPKSDNIQPTQPSPSASLGGELPSPKKQADPGDSVPEVNTTSISPAENQEVSVQDAPMSMALLEEPVEAPADTQPDLLLASGHSASRGVPVPEAPDDWAGRLEQAQANLANLEAQKKAVEEREDQFAEEAKASVAALTEEIEEAKAVLKATEDQDLAQYEKLTQ